jgi:hypothetical protein
MPERPVIRDSGWLLLVIEVVVLVTEKQILNPPFLDWTQRLGQSAATNGDSFEKDNGHTHFYSVDIGTQILRWNTL